MNKNERLSYEILCGGNSLALKTGFLGLSSITLVWGHPDGPLLFDCGHYATRQGLLDGLARHHLQPRDVPWLFLSHCHYDHALNLTCFPPTTRVMLGRAELEYAQEAFGLDPNIPWKMADLLRTHQPLILEGEVELALGLRAIPAPGHTPGSYALLLSTTQKGQVLLAGDAIKSVKEVIRGVADRPDGEQAVAQATVAYLVSLAERIVPGHFPELVSDELGGWTWMPAEVPLLVR